MASVKPVVLALGVLLVFGLIIPTIFSFFVTFEDIPTNSLVTPLSDFIDDGVDVDLIPFIDYGEVNVNIFSLLGTTLRTKLSNSILYLGLYPEWLLVTIIVLVLTALIVWLAMLIRGN